MPRQIKKTALIDILEILRLHTDEDHRLSQKEIASLLEKEYGLCLERKAVGRNLCELIARGCPVEYSETPRSLKNAKTGAEEESSVKTGFYYRREFTGAELRYLIDGVLFSKNVPPAARDELIGKLEDLGGPFFRSRMRRVRVLPDDPPVSRQLFYTIEALDEAISTRKKATFFYNSYTLDKDLVPRKDKKGNAKRYTVSPYRIAASGGRYYLICNTDPYDNVSHYRLDRVTGVKIAEETSRREETVEGLENGIDLERHLAEHILMFTSRAVPVAFRMDVCVLNDVIDRFGRGVVFSDRDGERVTARVKVDPEAMRLWAAAFGRYVRILSPSSLEKAAREDLQEALKRYEGAD